MEALTGNTPKIFSADNYINEQKSRSARLCTKSAGSITMMQHHSNSSSFSYSIHPSDSSSPPASDVIRCHSSSKSEVGSEMVTTVNTNIKSVCVKFQLEKECQFGDHILMVGDDPVLGSWNPSDAIPFNWSEGHNWSVVLEMPIEKSFQYKFLLKKSSGEILWQPGPDRTFRSWETKSVITVSEQWGNANAQKLSEEQEIVFENEELPTKTLVDPSLMDLPKYPKENPMATVTSHIVAASSASAEDPTVTVNRNRTILRPEDGVSNKKGTSSDRNAQKREASTRKSTQKITRVDKGSAEAEDEGSLVTYDEGPVLVPGLTLPMSS